MSVRYLTPICLLLLFLVSCKPPTVPKVLVFTKTAGWRHDCIDTAVLAIRQLAKESRFQVEHTEDASQFNEANLKRFSAVVFLCTTGDVLNEAQQLDFERFIQAGGGFVGVHSASDTEYEWPWFGKLVGAYFLSHPAEWQKATVDVVDQTHQSTAHLPKKWQRVDEWYNFKAAPTGVKVLMTLDEKTYKEGTMPDNHPIAWCHDYDGGRGFYTALGHTKASYAEANFLKHILGGIKYAIGSGRLDYSKVTFEHPPTDDRFTSETLVEGLDEPMEMSIRPNGDVWFVERKGDFKIFEHKTGNVRTVHHFDVHSEHEDGLLGIVLDPNFDKNGWFYTTYSPNIKEAVQYVSRWTYDGYSVDTTSEKVVIKIPVQRDECCHSAGCLRFDKHGDLWISIGDNTNPFNSDGYSPSDEQAKRSAWDAQRSSANTQDLRGKILRITPKPDGTYVIPKGNLFTDARIGRPEIYVMGCRNPFRFMIDSHNGNLYWGEVGPDAANDSLMRGPRGHDEVNQAKKSGFFGWPYFVGNNKPYYEYDFAAKRSAAQPHNPKKPINNSPNNTGATELPPAQSAFIWYPYGKSPEFPLTAEGSRNAMAGPVFHRDDFDEKAQTFPAYFENKLLIYDWMRNWVFAVSMDNEGNYRRMDRMFSHLKFNNSMDMQYGADGALYVLQYGTGWFLRNDDARIVRIKYNPKNRPPVGEILADATQGAAPLTVKFSSDSTHDYDGDKLKYEWHFENKKYPIYDRNPSITFTEAGVYRAKLILTDIKGNKTVLHKTIEVGNSVPQIALKITGNQTFYSDGGSLSYHVSVRDREDGSTESGSIAPDSVRVSCNFIPQGYDKAQAVLGHQKNTGATSTPNVSAAEKLMNNSDCNSCHGIEKAVNGPSFNQIALRYVTDKNAPSKLATKIIKGGSGAWGERAMAAHPDLKMSDAQTIAAWILNLAADKAKSGNSLPISGLYAFKSHPVGDANGTYIFRASYQDHGSDQIGAIERSTEIALRSPKIEAEARDTASTGVTIEDKNGQKTLVGLKNNSYFGYQMIDLTSIKKVKISLVAAVSGHIELHLDSPTGPTIGTATITKNTVPLEIPFSKTTVGKHNFYIVFRNTKSDLTIASPDWVQFGF